MKQTALIVLLFFVTLGLALWALGVFHSEPSPLTAPETPPTPPSAAMGDGDLTGGGAEPKGEPTPEIPEFVAPVRVLLLGDTHRSFTAWLEQLWDFAPAVQWQAWYANAAPAGVRTHALGAAALDKAPAGPDLEGVQVLVLAGLNPASMPADFWSRVADRVKSGSLGLAVIVDNRFAFATGAEPSLASILPVRGVKDVVPVRPGSADIHGVYQVPAMLRATDAGTKHVATRLTSWPGWSRRMWDQQVAADADGRWETKFCAAVEAPVEGATVLVEATAGPSRAPAVVAHDSPTRRVLWVGGFFDVADPAYRGSKSIERVRAMFLSWIWFLSGGKA
jgi:hypothetical protein